jgi:hypothetical protein
MEIQEPPSNIEAEAFENLGIEASVEIGNSGLLPFQMCPKREEWDKKYGPLFKMDVEEEKRLIEEKRKAPRKPLSPYIFYS